MGSSMMGVERAPFKGVNQSHVHNLNRPIWNTAQNAANLANIRYNLNPEDLVVAEAFVNRANVQKGVMIHGRGALWALSLRSGYLVLLIDASWTCVSLAATGIHLTPLSLLINR